jgi:hypothetical protein
MRRHADVAALPPRLQVTTSTPDSSQQFSMMLRKADGSYRPLTMMNWAAATTTEPFMTSMVGTLTTPAPPSTVWACLPAVPARNLPQQCTALPTINTNVPA